MDSEEVIGKSICNSKAGFTLLEVVLSIAIMLVMTTMMMNGFAATMTYSFHTSVYASTAASNYSKAIGVIAKNSQKGVNAYATMGKGTPGCVDTDLRYLQSTTALADVGTLKLNVQVFREDGGADMVSGASVGDFSVGRINANQESWGGASDADGSFADNRTSFYYLPAQMGDEYDAAVANNHGKFRVFYKPTGSDKGYYWVDTTLLTPGQPIPASAWVSSNKIA